MKNKSSWRIMSLVMGLGCGTMVLAQEEREPPATPPERPVAQVPVKPQVSDWDESSSFTIGTKVWFNEWERDVFVQDTAPFIAVGGGPGNLTFNQISINQSDTRPSTATSSTEITPIPQLSVKFKRVFFTGSYFYNTNYDFTQGQSTRAFRQDLTSNGFPGITSEETVTFTNRLQGERTEWDANGGFYLNRYLAVLLGYKDITRKNTYISTPNTSLRFVDSSGNLVPGTTTSNFPGRTGTSFINDDISGLTLGIAGSAPIWNGFGIYATYAHGFLGGTSTLRDVTGQVSTSDLKVAYDLGELGFSYTQGTSQLFPHMPLSAATFYAGYRYQRLDVNIKGSNFNNRTDTTQGFVMGLNLAF